MMRQVRAFDEWPRGDLLTASPIRLRAIPRRSSTTKPEHRSDGLARDAVILRLRGGGRRLSQPHEAGQGTRVDEPATKVLTADEYQRLRYHVDRQAKRPGMANFTWKRDRSILGVLWDTGMMRGELAALNVDDVDLETQRILVRKSKTRRRTASRLSQDDTGRGCCATVLHARERHALGYPARTVARCEGAADERRPEDAFPPTSRTKPTST